MLLEDVTWDENKKNSKYGVHYNIYNDPLNLKVHVFRAMCIWKPYMKNIPYPLPMSGIFKVNNLWTTFFYLFNIC